jgi:hypothetical protein
MSAFADSNVALGYDWRIVRYSFWRIPKMAVSVRVWFYNSSVSGRQNLKEMLDITESRTSVREFIRNELVLGERLARRVLLAMFGDQISDKDIIEATLAISTQEGLELHHDKTIIVVDADEDQIRKLVKSYCFPKNCTEVRVVFCESCIDSGFHFKTKILRDTSEDGKEGNGSEDQAS